MNFLEDLGNVFKSYYADLIQLTPKIIIGFLVTLVIYFIIGKLNKKAIAYFHDRTDDKLMVTFLKNILNFTKILIAILFFLYMIGQVGLASTIFGAATISSVIIGFAFKDIAENFLSGVIMAFNRPFRIGDVIKTGNVEGNIVSMSLRETHIKTYDGKDVYVPNGQIIKNPLYNFTIDGFLRKSFTIGLDYCSDIDTSRKIILDSISTINGILKEDKMPKTFISELSPSTIKIEVQYWLDTFDKAYSGTEIQTQAIKLILTNLAKEGINIPMDVIEIKNYQNLPFVNEQTAIKKSA